ncbi:uncharacterized protein METZ01_LOCUS506073, partial [marine metagenome]
MGIYLDGSHPLIERATMLSHGFRSYLLFCSLLLGCIFVNPARSGTNEGFKASVEPRA